MPGALRLSTMNAVLTNEVTQDMEVVATSFFFPRGLLGFEHVKKYSLTSKESEAPFSRLRMEEGNGLTLLVMPIMSLFPDYSPGLAREDLEMLQIQDAGELLMFHVVNLKKGRRPTVNLKGPILLNTRTGVGAQVVITNAADYSTKESLPL